MRMQNLCGWASRNRQTAAQLSVGAVYKPMELGLASGIDDDVKDPLVVNHASPAPVHRPTPGNPVQPGSSWNGAGNVGLQ